MKILDFILRHLFMLVLGLWIAIIGFFWPKATLLAVKGMVDAASEMDIFRSGK